MKAAVFKGAGLPMQIEEIADPTPGEQQLVVQVAYCGICGTDLHSTREGPAMLPCNSVLGHEFVGEVVALGGGLQGSWQRGDRVCALPFISCGHCPATRWARQAIAFTHTQTWSISGCSACNRAMWCRCCSAWAAAASARVLS